MPLPKGLARFNRKVTNRITSPFARRLPSFCVLEHTGRMSGNAYETPLNAWRQDDEIVVALTYGPDVDWLKNARAAEHSTMVIGQEEMAVGPPERMSRAEGYRRLPKVVGVALAALDVDEFVVFPIIS